MKRELRFMDSIGERIETVGFDALTLPERYYWAIWWLEEGANNGTFHQYFSNNSGDLIYDALNGLKAIGAHQTAALFQAAIDLFPDGQVPIEREQRNEVLNAFTAEHEERLDQLSAALWLIPMI